MGNLTRKVIQDRPKADGSSAVLIRLTKDRLHVYLGTSVYIHPKHFNPDGTYDSANWIRKSYTGHATANLLIKALLDRVAAVVKRFAELGNTHYTATQAKAAVEGMAGDTFSGFIEEQIKKWGDAGQFSNERNHSQLLTQLRRFMARTDDEPIHFAELTPERCKEFEQYLLVRPNRNNRPTTPAKRRNSTTDLLRRLHQHLIAYVKAHRLPDEADPMREMRLTTAPVDRHRLTIAEIDLFISAELPKGGKWETANHARNFYICAYGLHGIRGGDLLQARVDQLQQVWEMEKGKATKRWRFFYTSDKKDLAKSVLIDEPILSTLLYYAHDRLPDEYIFPFLKPRPKWDARKHEEAVNSQIVYIDRLLREVAKHLDIPKNPTIHTARHSFADQLYDEVGDLRVVQQALGHKSILTTERYITAMKQTTVDKANILYSRWKKDEEKPEGETPLRKIG